MSLVQLQNSVVLRRVPSCMGGVSRAGWRWGLPPGVLISQLMGSLMGSTAKGNFTSSKLGVRNFELDRLGEVEIGV